MPGTGVRPYGRWRHVTTKEVPVKRLLIASLLALLLVPAAASAMLPREDPPVGVRHENGPALSSPAARITTTNGGGDSTLSIVLASAALGIALGGTAYMTFRLRPMQRSS